MFERGQAMLLMLMLSLTFGTFGTFDMPWHFPWLELRLSSFTIHRAQYQSVKLVALQGDSEVLSFTPRSSLIHY